MIAAHDVGRVINPVQLQGRCTARCTWESAMR